jgi:outer membrane protein, multidrug efflux system
VTGVPHTVRILCGLLALPLCACGAFAPPRHEPVAIAVPAGWSAVDAAAGGAAAIDDTSLSNWWQRFDDPPLNDLIARALQSNTSIVAAQAAARQSQAERDGAAAALWPTLDATASAQRGKALGQSTANQFKFELGANWAPDVFGAQRAALDAADAALQASAASLGDTQVQVTADVALQVIVLRTARARLALAEDNLASQQETLQITSWRQQAGLVTTLEVEQAQAAVEQTRAVLPALQTLIAQTQHGLAVLSGQPPVALPAPVNEALDVPQAREGIALAIPADALRQRADVRAAEFQVAAALARVGQAQAQRWPSFAIGGSLGMSSLTLSALNNGASVVRALLASVSLPVFDGGASRANVRLQQAAFEQAEQGYRAAVLAALQDVENALVAFFIKGLGDDTRRLPARLKVGDLVRVEGPYGRFNFDSAMQRQIWVGGGIGITPFIARLRELALEPDGKHVDLFQTSATADAGASARLKALALDAKVELHQMVDAIDGRLNANRLCAAVPDWRSADVWFCGPAAFGRALRRDLLAKGLLARNFHQELFNLR